VEVKDLVFYWEGRCLVGGRSVSGGGHIVAGLDTMPRDLVWNAESVVRCLNAPTISMKVLTEAPVRAQEGRLPPHPSYPTGGR